jgi:hypothetical protein
MVIVWQNRTVNRIPRINESAGKIKVAAIPRARGPARRLRPIHRDT